jgi:hypothetical protein
MMTDPDINKAEAALRSEGFGWVKNEGEGLRWARHSDLPDIVDMALEAFKWSYDAARLQHLWSEKPDLNIFVVLEQQRGVKGFMEVFWKKTKWRPPTGIPMKIWFHEWLAHKLLCDRRYSKDGPYIFLIARHSTAPKGAGAMMVRELQKHHDVVSVMYDRRNRQLDAYYRDLGFSERKNPLPSALGRMIDRKYVYAQWRANANPK